MCVYYYVFSAVIAVMGIAQLFPSKMPQFVQDLVLYGKIKGDRKQWTVVQLLEVPKKWFLHFYVVGVFSNGLMTFLIARAYLTGSTFPHFINTILSWINSTPSGNDEYTKPVMALLCVMMMFIQNSRRFYECMFVSVYSKGTMNLIHYHLGIVLYSTFPFVTLAYSVLPTSTAISLANFISEINFSTVCGILLFLWASHKHNESHHILASLRLDKSGNVAHREHKIPYGGLFEYVSSPHFFCEILIYVAYVLTAGWRNSGVYSVFFFVLINQMVASFLTHKWYLDTFQEKYPKNRRILVPYIM